MKFASVQKGKRAERRLTFPYLADEAQPIDVACVAVPLSGSEEADAIAFAVTYAKGKGIADPKPNEPLYDLGYMARVVATAVRDPDSGREGHREPTFSGPEEVLAELPRETITFLYEIVEGWCDECSPTTRTLNDATMMAVCMRLAKEGDEASLFFDRLGPAMRKHFALFTARRLWNSLEAKSPSGGPSDSGGPSLQPS